MATGTCATELMAETEPRSSGAQPGQLRIEPLLAPLCRWAHSIRGPPWRASPTALFGVLGRLARLPDSFRSTASAAAGAHSAGGIARRSSPLGCLARARCTAGPSWATAGRALLGARGARGAAGRARGPRGGCTTAADIRTRDRGITAARAGATAARAGATAAGAAAGSRPAGAAASDRSAARSRATAGAT